MEGCRIQLAANGTVIVQPSMTVLGQHAGALDNDAGDLLKKSNRPD